MKVKRLLFLLMLLLSLNSMAQRHTKYSRSELGFMFGQMYYIGDLNPFKQFYNMHYGGGLAYRYNYHSRTAFRLNLIYGQVSGDDSKSTEDVIHNRNLSFASNIVEASALVEFSYFPFQIGHDRYKGSCYLFGGIATFHMNPYTMLDGTKTFLQPLGTEGQESKLSSRNKYSLMQVSLPIGIGAKLTLFKMGTLNLEFGIRKTFTDYLDDVHEDTYVDRATLIEQNGATAGALSNRSLDNDPYGKRGTSSTKDWYVYFGAMISFKLGPMESCPSAR